MKLRVLFILLLAFTVASQAYAATGDGRMKREVFHPAGAPKPTGPFSPAVRMGSFVYAAGQVGAVSDGVTLISDDVVEQTAQALKNLKASLAAAGASMEDVVKANVYLTDMNDFARMNAEYAKVFAQNPPARTCVAVKDVPVRGKVEIEVIAIVGDHAKREVFYPAGAPKPTGPFSPAVRKGPVVYAAGQVGAVSDGVTLISDDVVEQTAQALKNLKASLAAAGASMEDVVKANVYLTDMNDFARMNAEYAKVFAQNPPARTCVAVMAVPVGGKVEIEVIAIVGDHAKREAFHPAGAPKPTGPFSPAVRKEPFVYAAGQVGAVSDGVTLISDDVVEQTTQALKNLKASLAAAGASMEDVVKANVYLTDMNDFARMNAEYAKVFAQNPPARTCVAVMAVPVGGKVEIEVIAIADK